MKRAAWALALAAPVVLVAGAAEAHQVGLSRGTYRLVDTNLQVGLTFARRELATLAPAADANHDDTVDEAELRANGRAIGDRLGALVRVAAAGRPCAPSFVSAQALEEDGASVALVYACPAPGPARVELAFFGELASGHRHLASVGSGTPRDLVVSEKNPAFEVGADGAAPPAARAGLGAVEMVELGVEHILTGYDHLVFLLGLVLVGGRLRSLLAVVTAFTLAHSITLGLAALHVVTLSPRLVEPAIALSIAYVGVENFFVPNAERRWRITFPFGLIHGFGFAGALAEIDLPRAEVPKALACFNVGVELGQLAVLALVLPLLAWLRRYPWFDRTVVRGASVLIVVAGLGWFVQRVFFA